MKGKFATEEKTIEKNREQLKGKHVLVRGEKIYTAKTAKKALEIFVELEKKDPQNPPLITYIPKEETVVV